MVSSRGDCCACSFIADIIAKGFCVGAVNNTGGVCMFVNGQVESYLGAHSWGKNGVHDILGVASGVDVAPVGTLF